MAWTMPLTQRSGRNDGGGARRADLRAGCWGWSACGQGGAALTVNIAGMITYGQRVVGIMEGDSDPQSFIPELIAAHRNGQFPFDRLVRPSC